MQVAQHGPPARLVCCWRFQEHPPPDMPALGLTQGWAAQPALDPALILPAAAECASAVPVLLAVHCPAVALALTAALLQVPQLADSCVRASVDRRAGSPTWVAGLICRGPRAWADAEREVHQVVERQQAHARGPSLVACALTGIANRHKGVVDVTRWCSRVICPCSVGAAVLSALPPPSKAIANS